MLTWRCSRFVREAEILAELRHPGIVRYIAHGVASDGDRYLAIEWLDGESSASGIGTTVTQRGPSLGPPPRGSRYSGWART